MITEYLLTTDNFSNPKTETGMKAVGIIIIRLLLLVPGTNPRHPEMGVGLGTIYRFITEDELSNLQEVIEYQMSTYLPQEFQGVLVDLSIDDDNCLVVTIIIDGIAFTFETKGTSGEVQLSEILN